MKQIPLSQGYVAIVDDEDYERLGAYKWSASVAKRGRVYAVRSVQVEGKAHQLALHREIANPPPGWEVDHRDGDTLNNQRSNLRVCTRSQNNANARKRLGASSRFKGVHFYRPAGKWAAQIRKRHLGLYDTEEQAAAAYDDAAKVYGEWRRPNLLERDIQKQIVDFLTLDGWRCLHLELNFSERKLKAIGERGMPDILAIRYARQASDLGWAQVLWLEAKTPKGRVAPHQHAWRENERARGALTLIAGVDFDASLEGFSKWYSTSGLERRALRIGGATTSLPA